MQNPWRKACEGEQLDQHQKRRAAVLSFANVARLGFANQSGLGHAAPDHAVRSHYSFQRARRERCRPAAPEPLGSDLCGACRDSGIYPSVRGICCADHSLQSAASLALGSRRLLLRLAVVVLLPGALLRRALLRRALLLGRLAPALRVRAYWLLQLGCTANVKRISPFRRLPLQRYRAGRSFG